MIPGEQLANTFHSNLWLIEQLTEGLSNEDSLWQPSYPGNCINWILGHLTRNRNYALRLLGAPVLPEAERLSRYQTGSDPILDIEEAIPLATILENLAAAQARLESHLNEASPETLEKIIDTPRGERPLWRELRGLGWHETYHVGQLELLREMILSDKDLPEKVEEGATA